jgi:hypothetical protein
MANQQVITSNFEVKPRLDLQKNQVKVRRRGNAAYYQLSFAESITLGGVISLFGGVIRSWRSSSSRLLSASMEARISISSSSV